MGEERKRRQRGFCEIQEEFQIPKEKGRKKGKEKTETGGLA